MQDVTSINRSMPPLAACRGNVPMKYIPSITVGIGAFIATFDVTAVSLLLPAISQTFSLDIAGYVWIMDAYSLAFTIILMSAGALSDRYGQRFTIVAGAIIFLIASVLCAYAGSFGALIAGRVIQGVGAGFVVCAGLAWAGRMYKDKSERAQAFAIIGTISGSALAIGPALGGLIATAFGWKWVFLMNIPICLAIIVGSLGWMEEHKNGRQERMDVLGTVLVSLLLLTSIWFLLHGPVVGGVVFGSWTFGLTIVVLLLLLIWVELKAPHPTVDISLFNKRAFVGLAMVPATLSVSYWSLIVYMPVFLQSSMQVGTESISYMMLFFTMPMFVVPFFVAKLAAETKQSIYYFAGLFVVSLGCLLISLGAFFSQNILAVVGMVVAGVGAATIQSQVSGALIASAPEERAGAASAILMVLRQGGFAVACALLATVMQAKVYLGPHSLENFTLLFSVCALVAAVGSACTFILIRSDEGIKSVDYLRAAARGRKP